MKHYAVIVAGGKGSRMQSDLPKQFMLLLEAPVLMHTIERFVHAIENVEIVLVLPKEQQQFWSKLCVQMDFDLTHQTVDGGATRYDSVKAGLALCPDTGIVAIHDGVRPMVSEELIKRCMEGAADKGSAIPVVPATQSLRKVEGEKSQALQRSGIVEVQTPQCFLLNQLQPCFKGESQDAFTDDATVFEAFGHELNLVEGEPTNLKITTQADLKIAEAILKMSDT